MGKITVFKSLAISKIVYISSITKIPNAILYELEKIHKDFIWNGKIAKIKHTSLISSIEQGGLQDIDIPFKMKALQLAW